MDSNSKIATYDGEYNETLGVEFPKLDIVKSNGLVTHVQGKHPNCVKYIDKINEILIAPDYVGINRKHPNSFELIKKYDDNVLLAIKLDIKKNYYYVASLYNVSQDKINNKLHSGRLKKYAGK